MIPERWRRAAVEPTRAHGAPVASGQLRATPEDFVVEEELGFEPSGSGSHVLLRVRKREANTEWVARALAREARCAPRDVGFAGLKDRRAIATQWFTVPAAGRPPAHWPGTRGEGYEVLEAHAHARKLPRGALAANRFTVRVSGFRGERAAVEERLARIAREGAPNYFGPQRFGRALANLRRAAEGGGPPASGFELSAARSLIFNALLDARVRDGSWCALRPGDLAILDGRGSWFAADESDAALDERVRALEVHPTGPMWGRGAPPSGGPIAALELAVAGELDGARALVESAGMRQERRSLRLRVGSLEHSFDADALTIRFRLGKGAFATTVLAELLGGMPADEASEL